MTPTSLHLFIINRLRNYRFFVYTNTFSLSNDEIIPYLYGCNIWIIHDGKTEKIIIPKSTTCINQLLDNFKNSYQQK